jgi:hypothetical protein
MLIVRVVINADPSSSWPAVLLQEFARVGFCDNVGIFRIHIEEIRIVRSCVAVAARVRNDYGYEAMRHSVNAGRPDATAGCNPGYDERIYALSM